jgi:hypothetical protein
MTEVKVSFYLKRNEEKADGTVPILGTYPHRKINGTVQCQSLVFLYPFGIPSRAGLSEKVKPPFPSTHP